MAQLEIHLPAFSLAVLSPSGGADSALLLAAGQAGELPIVDAVQPASLPPLTPLDASLDHRFGIRLDAPSVPRLIPLLGALGGPIELLLLSGPFDDLTATVGSLRPFARRIFREVVSVSEADGAVVAGIEGLVARGNECGGPVGTETTFVLLQRLAGRFSLPIWVQGGITPNSLAACLIGGASGAILDSQLALAEEAGLPEALRNLLTAMDGTETVCVGESLGRGYRVHRMRGTARLRALQEAETHQGDAQAFGRTLDESLRATEGEALWPVGQEASLAARLAAQYRTATGILRAYRRQAIDNLKQVAASPPLEENSPFALAHGLRYPILQGPMTRVSDVPGFADAVAQAGGLPFLALALLREPDARRLLDETSQLLQDRPWGVGLLAFVPPELRTEQTRAVLAARPRFVLLAGGRPDQAQVFDQAGITTFLHCPSPRLLEMFLKEGARRFVFEGRECGGHVGPLSSFLLWESCIEVLLRFRRQSADPIDVVFAGGIHDARSAAMVAALAAPLTRERIRIAVLLGTAYLFTREAVTSGAIVPAFQELALACDETVLLDAQGGHAIRCIPTSYADEFNALKRSLLQKGASSQEARENLEEVNLGRLRIASKGLRRTVPLTAGPPAERGRESHLVSVPVEVQRREGMYMIGQVGALRDQIGTIAELHEDVSQGSSERLRALAQPASKKEQQIPIAIIGMSCIFPDAPDVGRYWANILRNHNAIREVPPERWKVDQFYATDPRLHDRVVSKWGGFFAPVVFDPMRFGIPPASIPSIEPLQLLVLEVAQRCLESAGYHARPFPRERTAVIIGAGGGACDLGLQYQTRAMVEHYLSLVPGLDPQVRAQALAGLQKVLPTLTEDSFAGTLCNVGAGRVANRFDLSGPNFAVDAACASSLAALEVSVLELRARTSDMVFLGGGDAQMNISSFLMFSKTHALSPRGRCRPFDAHADGIAISEGLAGVILKRLDEALRDGDHVYAVLRSVGSASDGRDKSMTAPSLNGQKRTLARAYEGIDFTPASVGMLEAHGTGTVVGDRTELQALCEIFSAAGARPQSCVLGSVKSQIGHTKNGAGLAGILKATLSLHHRTLPPTLFEAPSPAVRDRSIPFYLSGRARPWFHSSRAPRRAAVSAFGFGGTNFHVVLEEFPGHTAALPERPAELFVFRAAARGDLAERLEHAQVLVQAHAGIRLVDLAAWSHREAAKARGECRLAFVVGDLRELSERLKAGIEAVKSNRPLPTGPIAWSEGKGEGKVAFLFPGQGSQYLNMLEGLALYFPIVREAFEEADRALDGTLPEPLTQVIFPPPAYSPDEEARQRQALDRTWFAQPALGAADFAMARLLESLGVEPDHLAGHSYGEYVALCVAGALSYDDLVKMSERRGRLVHETQGDGAVGLVAVQASVGALAPVLVAARGIAVAACNAPEQTVLGGCRSAIDALLPMLEKYHLGYQRLAVSAGFHIPEAQPAADRFAEVLSGVTLDTPRRQVWSNRTAAPYPADAGSIRQLLREHLTEPVRFKDEVEALYAAGCRTFLEVGPGQVLSGLAQLSLAGRDDVTVLATNRRGPGGAMPGFLETVGRLYVQGRVARPERLFAGCEVKPIDIHELGKVEKMPPTAWILTGGSARPAKEKPSISPEPPAPASAPAPVRTPPVSVPMPASAPVAVPTPHRAVPSNGTHSSTPPVPPIPATPAVPAGAGSVMSAFQESMRQFLDYQARSQEQRQTLMQQFLQTQASIVQAYLQGTPVALPAPTMHPPTGVSAPVATALAPLASAPAFEAPPSPPEPVPAEPAPKAGVDLLALPVAQRDERLQALLLELVSDRTGYPIDLLELDHNMEADLGIDSIKRTEIFGGLRDRLGFHGEAYEKEEFYIKLGKLRTLREVLTWLTEDALAPQAAPELPPLALPAPDDSTHTAHRFVLEAIPAPLIEGDRRLPRDREVILVTDGPSGRGRQLFSLLRGLDYDLAFVQHSSEPRIVRAGQYEANLLSVEGVKQLRGWIEQHHGRVTTLCHLLPLDPGEQSREADCLEVRSLFYLTGGLSLDLIEAKGTVLAATGMGGSFGVGGPDWHVSPGQAGVVGFLKSLAREWQACHVKALDVDPDIDDHHLLAQIVSELQTTDRKVEVGYVAAGRCVLDVVQRPVERSPEPMIELDSDAVLLVLGGARGITASICEELSRRYCARMILVGRSPRPEPESAHTSGLAEQADLKRALADERRRRGELVTPIAVESAFRALLASRELQSNLDRLTRLGGFFEYHSLDVRDEQGLATLIRSVYERHGRIDGVVHAAGLLGDSLLVGKAPESFDRVFDTKVVPALVLARELRPESLRFLCFFSSVAARFGNVGQTDYAAANEVLNKLAAQLDRRWPARVFAIGWGPWDEIGMARPEKMSVDYLASIGFTHMPVEEGREQFLQEVAYGHKGQPEVLIFRPNGNGPSESAYAEAQFYRRAGAR